MVDAEGPVRVRREERRRDLRRPPAPAPLRVPVADNHCHLDIADGEGPEAAWWPVEEALAAAAEVGVPRIVQIGCDLPSARWTVETVERFGAVVGGVALHPNEAPRLAAAGRDVLEAAWAEVERLAAHPRVRVVGETGLDYYRTGEDGRAVQDESFRRHVDMARRLGLALQIHDRDAHEDVLRVLREEHAEDIADRVVFHCFSGDADIARRAVEAGYVLSFAGTVTFKNAQPLRDALAVVPLDRLLVETDAPFLTPTPYRGRPNASYLVPLTVRAMAEVKGVDEDTMATAIAATTDRVYGPW